MIVVKMNGDHLNGGRGATLDELRERLRETPLCPRFEEFGNFVIPDPVGAYAGTPLYKPGTVVFFGGFYAWSHAFHIATDEPNLIAELTSLIRANQATAEYASAKAEMAAIRERWRELDRLERERSEARRGRRS